jgi:hypothetical protein
MVSTHGIESGKKFDLPGNLDSVGYSKAVQPLNLKEEETNF